jgi:hypothetical protein
MNTITAEIMARSLREEYAHLKTVESIIDAGKESEFFSNCTTNESLAIWGRLTSMINAEKVSA